MFTELGATETFIAVNYIMENWCLWAVEMEIEFWLIPNGTALSANKASSVRIVPV